MATPRETGATNQPRNVEVGYIKNKIQLQTEIRAIEINPILCDLRWEPLPAQEILNEQLEMSHTQEGWNYEYTVAKKSDTKQEQQGQPERFLMLPRWTGRQKPQQDRILHIICKPEELHGDNRPDIPGLLKKRIINFAARIND